MHRPSTRSSSLVLPVALTVLLLLSITPDMALAQGCAMCRTALGVDDPVTQGFNWSIVFLMVMPYALFASVIGWVLYTRRRSPETVAAGP